MRYVRKPAAALAGLCVLMVLLQAPSAARAQSGAVALVVAGPGATAEFGYVAHGALAAQGLAVDASERARSVGQAILGALAEAPDEGQAVTLRSALGAPGAVVLWIGGADEAAQVPVTVWVARGSEARQATVTVPAAELTGRIPQLLARVPAALDALVPAATPGAEPEAPSQTAPSGPPAGDRGSTAPRQPIPEPPRQPSARPGVDAARQAPPADPGQPFVNPIGEVPPPAGGWDGGRSNPVWPLVLGLAAGVGAIALLSSVTDPAEDIAPFTLGLVSGIVAVALVPVGIYIAASGVPGPPESSGARFGLAVGVAARGSM